MKKIFIKKFAEIILIILLLLGCVSAPSQTTTPPTTVPSTTASPAQFEIIDLRVIPENPKVGDTLTILVDVQNKGDSSGNYTILVTIGSKSKTQNIEVEGKSSKTVKFQEIVDTGGNIKIEAGKFIKTRTVSPSETPTTTTPPKRELFFYILQGKFIQTTEYEYEIYLECEGENQTHVNVVTVPSVSSYHFSQQVFSQRIEYSETPDKITRKKDDSVRYERAEWSSPPPKITVKRTAECKNIVSYSPFITQSRYPLNTKALPSNIKKYLDPIINIQCDDPEIIALAEELVEGAESAMDAIVRILNWVRYNVVYTCSKDLKVCERVLFADAKRTLKHRKGNCVNIANLSIALLRAAEIPAKKSSGKVADSEYESAAGHAWISVYIPEEGFIEFESSYWMPRSGLVPETILMPQHIVYGTGVGISAASFCELHRTTQEVTSIPEKKTHISESTDKDDIISFLAYVEEKEWTGKYKVSFKVVAPSGWKVFLSNETVEIDTDKKSTKEILITIIRPPDAKSGDEAEIKIIADDGSQQGEIVIHLSIE